MERQWFLDSLGKVSEVFGRRLAVFTLFFLLCRVLNLSFLFCLSFRLSFGLVLLFGLPF